MKVHLIQGIFFSDGDHEHWSGLIRETEEGSGIFVGQTTDRYGVADLTDIVLGEGKISFKKKYQQRRDTISYAFDRRHEDGYWEGRYSGSATGTDAARCFLSPQTSEKFFEEPELHPTSAN